MTPRLLRTALAVTLGLLGVACGDEAPVAAPVPSTSTASTLTASTLTASTLTAPSTSPSTTTSTAVATTAVATTAVATTAPTSTSTTARQATSTTVAGRPALPAGWERCTDGPGGYAVGYPGDWHILRLESGNCHFFDPQPILAPPNSDGIATWFSVFAGEYPRRSFVGPDAVDNYTTRILSAREVTLGGRTMLVRESETTREIIFPVGTRSYGYFLDCGAGSVHLSTLSEPGRPESEFAAKMAVLDRAAPTLECLR